MTADAATLAADLRDLHTAGRIKSPWLAGMLDGTHGDRVDHIAPSGMAVCRLHRGGFGGLLAGALPDLSDPITVQALLLLLREATGDPCACLYWQRGERLWHVLLSDGSSLGRGAAERDAIAAAIHHLADECRRARQGEE